LKVERASKFNTAGGSEFLVRGAAVLNDRLANDVRRKEMCATSPPPAKKNCRGHNTGALAYTYD